MVLTVYELVEGEATMSQGRYCVDVPGFARSTDAR